MWMSIAITIVGPAVLHFSIDFNETGNTFLTVKEELDYIWLELKKKNTNWNISVIRNKFNSTTMDQFEEANEEDWLKPIKVRFIGEEGIDAGGLTREFLSLLFKESPIFEDSVLSLNPQLLEDQHYLFMGRMTSIAILEGHPGPRRFNQFLVDFILLDKIPQFSLVDKNELKRADAIAAIEEIENCTEDTIKDVFNNCLDILCTTGFDKNLNMTNKQQQSQP
ncbi:hypothetical protein LOTGIDRAFT_174259 [Lottia gigantea]|uniref:HECT-type E3 ubiquitin transferase n=1 Tax=Lottia gigantea TaxID=225164 RepID=V4AU73_LOTGI|nr:hypothetical protein LOTGIDRAFT_174259 [Lottia gigantea]ESO98490.1 hypothetical protein LOTGIDRAFT_174259 [Lottia gigantea]